MVKFVNSFFGFWTAITSLIIGLTLISFSIYLHIPIKQSLLESDKSNILTDWHGEKLYEILSYNNQKNQYVDYTQISPHFWTTLIATEDKRFYQHQGVDFLANLRALKDNIILGRIVSGASSITQQLAKKVLEHQKRGIKEKIQETILAWRLENQFSKEEILELYANKVSFGSVFTGIRSASEAFFAKSPANLDLAESAFLVGILKSPSYYSPFNNFAEAKLRQEFVLRQLDLSPMKYKFLAQEKLKIATEKHSIQAPHFVFYALEQLKSNTKNYIQTSLNLGLQKQIQRIVEQHLNLISSTHNVSNAAVLVFEADTGRIRVMLGSRDFFDENIDGEVNLLLSERQVGSTLKPFLYLLSFIQLGWQPNTQILDEADSFLTAQAQSWEPKNYDLKWHGQVSIRQALAQSLNMPAVKTLEQIGEQQFLAFLQRLGINVANSDYGLSLALGTPNIRLLDLAHAYGILANGGHDFDFQYLDNKKSHLRKIIPTKEIAEIVDIMSDNQARIEAFGEDSVLNFTFPVAVKTGTTRDFKDNYCIGFNDNLVLLVWVGNSDGSPMNNVSGITGAGPLFHKIMNLIATDRSPKKSPTPSANSEKIIQNLQIIYPLSHSEFKLNSALSPERQKIKLVANKECEWWLDDELLGEGREIWWTPIIGRHEIRAVGGGEEMRKVVEVR